MDNRILKAAQTELQRHTWSTFVDEGLTIALGGQGIVTPGCEACRKRINTNSQYLRHLAEDVLPGILESGASGPLISLGLKFHGADGISAVGDPNNT
jgi:hypothetical protein